MDKKKRLETLLKRMNYWSCKISENKREFDSLIEEIYGVHYSDVDKDYIIDAVDYGNFKISFEEFDKIMKEANKKFIKDESKDIKNNAFKEKAGAFDIWVCGKHGEFERSINLKSHPTCPKCKSRSLAYRGQVAR